MSLALLLISGCAPDAGEPFNQATIQNPLNDYLHQVDQTEREIEFKRVQTHAFTSKSGDIYADIRYSCGAKLCDHALVQIKNDEQKVIHLHSGSIFQRHIFSPDGNYVAVLLGRNEGTEVVRNSVMVIRTEPFTLAEFQGKNELASMLTAPEFTIPIISLDWANDTTLKAEIPGTADYTFETLATWNQHRSKTMDVRLTVK